MNGFILVSAISVLSISSAFADRGEGHGWGNRGGGYGQQEWRGDHDRDGGYGHRGWRGDHDRDGYGYGGGFRPGYQQPYTYAQPIYVPPPVYAPPPMYYAPRQAPGINLFFPLNLYR